MTSPLQDSLRGEPYALIDRWPSRPYARFVTVALSGVLLLATLYTLYFARDFMIPIAAAIILSLVFAPIVRTLSRKHVPSAVTGGFVVLMIVAALSAGIVTLSGTASDWLNRAPKVLTQLDRKLKDIKRPVEQVKKASEQVEALANAGGTGTRATNRGVVVNSPNFLKQMVGTMQAVMIQLGVTLVLLFFLLASGDVFKFKLVTAMARLSEKKRALSIWRDVEQDVSVYLRTITIINAGLGVVIGLGLYAIGLPNALLWGVMAALLNFIPYIGALVGLSVVSVVAIITFDSLSHAMIAPLVYAASNLAESQFVTPSILGKRLSLNPVVVFVSVIFWGWLWGMPGAMMAVPMLITVNGICTHFPALRIVAEFLTLEAGDRKA
jgi:predicted PurR-regulated permease PerM